MMIKAFLFDIGGVLIPSYHERLIAVFAQKLSIDAVVLSRLVAECERPLSLGEKRMLDLFSGATDLSSNAIDPNVMLKTYSDIVGELRADQRMVSMIKLLKEKYIVSCLSNTEIETSHIIREKPFFSLFDHAFLSCETGLMKPSDESFKHAAEALNVPPNRILFIDDVPENIEAASLLGFHCHQFSSAELFESHLEQININVQQDSGGNG